jgi:hypothetical protein
MKNHFAVTDRCRGRCRICKIAMEEFDATGYVLDESSYQVVDNANLMALAE